MLYGGSDRGQPCVVTASNAKLITGVLLTIDTQPGFKYYDPENT
jgi:hypothetical protein